MPKIRSLSPIYIIDGLRTVIGNPHKSLKKYSAGQLIACVIKEIIKRNKIKKTLVDEVIIGNVVSAGTGQNLARQATIMAKLPEHIPSFTVNNVCGAGMQSIVLAIRTILMEENDMIIAGGTESTTKTPYLVNREDFEHGQKADYHDSLVHDGLFCQLTEKSMGDLVESLSRKYKISRRVQDRFSLKSHQKACLAQNKKVFKDEILPLKNEKNKIVKKDDRPRRNISMESLKILPPAFQKKGTVTAGNSSVPCDGAAAVLIGSEKIVKSAKLKPKAKILGYSSIAVNPALTFESTISAIQKCLDDCAMKIEDIDLFEISEAFASQVLLTQNKLKIHNNRLNVYGGDVAFGHPLGAAGCRVVITLMNALKKKNLKYGLACVSYGGGGSMAMIIENLS